MRSVFAVLTGYVVFAACVMLLVHLSGHDPHGSFTIRAMVIFTLCGMGFAGLAGFLTTILAPRAEFEHSFAVATLIVATGATFLMSEIDKEGIGLQIAALLIIAPMAMVGADFRLRQTGRRGIFNFKARAGSRHQGPS